MPPSDLASYELQGPFVDSSDHERVKFALEKLAAGGVEERGAIFTRRAVVEFILDVTGYTPNRKLAERRVLEPSFGHGDFLEVVIERLLKSYSRFKSTNPDLVRDLKDSIRAVELHQESANLIRSKVTDLLTEFGATSHQALDLVDNWIKEDDFLLTDLPTNFTHVVGNPPYVRQELIPDVLLAEYKARYSTIYDRADLYIPFIERSLRSLAPDGVLGFICADRWMKNRYGGPLRELVANEFHLRAYVDMVGTEAFHSDVLAYPAITIIAHEKGSATRIAHRPKVTSANLKRLARELTAKSTKGASLVTEVTGVVCGREPWLLDSADQLAIIRRLESEHPKLEEAGCKVGIGVATGADKIFIQPYESLDVEPGRKLPILRTADIRSGNPEWKGMAVLNPYQDDGALVDLSKYPRLAAYFDRHREKLETRHCATRNPDRWYRTIDRIHPGLLEKAKLLIPDIKGDAHVVYDDGRYYPHHNLYYVVSDEWDLRALQAVLSSKVAKLFVATYSTQMSGGFLRFQAQYLRRIRIPNWKSVSTSHRRALMAAGKSGDQEARDRATFDMYGLTPEERAALGGNGEK